MEQVYPRDKQLFVHSDEPCEEQFNSPDPDIEMLKDGSLTEIEICKEVGHRVRRMKPHGSGLWSSTRIEGASSMWSDYIQTTAETLKTGDESVWHLKPEPDIRVYTIEDVEDVRGIASLMEEELMEHESPITGELVEGWYRNYAIDFYSLSQEYDAVWLPSDAIDKTRLPGTEHPELASWDVESTVWLNWCFEDVEMVADSLPEVT